MSFSKMLFTLVLVIAVFTASPAMPFSKEIVLFSFERDPEGWEIPDWAFTKQDHVAETIGVSEFQACDGKYALEVGINFPGTPGWRGAYVERVADVTDWSIFNYISVNIFLPKDAPRGLRAKIILTTGEDWKWTEMNRSVPLAPGEWTVVKADLTQNSLNWRKFITDNFRADVKKIGIRIESNGKIAYKGPIYMDCVKLSE